MMREKLQLLLGTGDEEEEKLRFLIETAEQAVKDICGLSELPLALENTVVLMAADLYHDSGIGSVKEGDVSIQFANTAKLGEKYKDRLARYKRIGTAG